MMPMPAAITPVMAAITLAIVATTVQRRIVVWGRALDPPVPVRAKSRLFVRQEGRPHAGPENSWNVKILDAAGIPGERSSQNAPRRAGAGSLARFPVPGGWDDWCGSDICDPCELARAARTASSFLRFVL
jgi:hypothetical protein